MDVSPQLLIGSSKSPLRCAFPAPLNSLTISLRLLVSASCIVSHSRPVNPDEAAIQSVQLTSETLECGVTLRSGHVVVYAYGEGAREASHQVHSNDEELVLLDHLSGKIKTFHPRLLIDNKFGSVSVCEISNIGVHSALCSPHLTNVVSGFVAIAYTSGALIVVDMRRLRVVFRDGTDPKANKRQSLPLQFHRTHDPRDVSIQSMKWFVCGFDAGKHIYFLISDHGLTRDAMSRSHSQSSTDN